MPAAEFSALRISAGPRVLVDGVDLEIGAGERWGLIGASGAGKSLTAAAVSGLLPPGVRAEGSVRVAGTELVGASERTLGTVRGAGVTLVAQDSATALHPLVPVGAQVARVLRTHARTGRRQAAAEAVERLAAVGLPEPASTARARPAQLSGGQRQRVALAAALACGARLLVADEPTAALDPTVADGILARLDEALRATTTALLYITHDLATLARLCDRVAVLHHGRVVETGRVDDVVAAPRHEHTRELVDAARVLVPSVRPESPA